MSQETDTKKEVEKESEKKEPDNEEGTKSATIDDVKKIVKEALDDVKDLFTGNSDPGSEDGGEKKEGESDGDEKNRRPLGRSFAERERQAEELVKAQVAKVLGEMEHAKEHEEMKTKKEPEKAPLKVRKLTKFMLGKIED